MAMKHFEFVITLTVLLIIYDHKYHTDAQEIVDNSLYKNVTSKKVNSGGDTGSSSRSQFRNYNSQPIKCYQCNSFYDRGCADFFDNRTYPLIPCPSEVKMCRKIIQETYYDGTWDIRYIRQCALEGEVGPEEGRWCKERVGTYRVKVKYCHCDNKDGCNSAMKMNLNLEGLLLVLLFACFPSLTVLFGYISKSVGW